MMQEDGQKLFWTNVLRAAEAEPKAARSIRGASGIQHPIIALGFDEDRRRLLLVSGEHDARTAAMAQVDVQAALENTQVLVARPIALNFTSLAKIVVDMLGKETITSDDITGLSGKPGQFSDALKQVLGPSLAPLDFISNIPLNTLAQWMNSIQQLAYCNFTFEDTEDPTKKRFKIDLRKLAELDPVEHDSQFGICPVPLYSLTADEVELLNGSPNLDDVREVLRQRHVLQYCFPPPDQLALGLIERGSTSPSSVLDQLTLAPSIGHPQGEMELIAQGTKLLEVIDALQDRRLVVEGEIGLEISPSGRQIRTLLKFKPREGLISKIISRFSVSVDLKNLIGLK
jgi:hypothetical protein